MGIRGIPACYGGFETFAEELATRLVERGHDVTVYGRSNIIKDDINIYKGVRIKILPTISHKYLDTVVHTFLSVIHSLFNRYDVILICNAANSVFSFIPRLVGQKVIVNVDGIERKRKKWGASGKLWYFFGEIFSCIFPNGIVTDAEVIKEYYRKRYRKDSTFIPYGTNIVKTESAEILQRFGLEKEGYILYVSRLEPENNAHVVIKAFENVKTDKRLVIVGDAPYSKRYIEELKKTKDQRIIFTGFVFGKGYWELQSHACCYVHATEVGGTHPALVEAMGVGNCIIANGTPENIEVLGDAGIIYNKNDYQDLSSKLQGILDNPEKRIIYKEKAVERARERYSWDNITDKYESLFLALLKRG